MSDRIRYRRRRSVTVRPYNERDWDIEPGDLLVDYEGNLYRAEESGGWGKRALGELSPRRIQPPRPTMKAVIDGDEVYWEERQP